MAGDLHTHVQRGRMVSSANPYWHAGCDVPSEVAVSAWDIHTGALRSDGQLVCFGAEDHGQCDDRLQFEDRKEVCFQEQSHTPRSHPPPPPPPFAKGARPWARRAPGPAPYQTH